MYWSVHLEGGPRRVNHAAVCVGECIYSFGGYCTGDNYRSWRPIDVHLLDTVSLRWKLIPTNPMPVVYDPQEDQIPFQRYGHTVVALNECIFLWGGRNDECACNVLYVFDTVTRKWLPRPKVSGSVPGPRDGHSACVINKLMYIFGGYEEETDRFSQEVYALNLETFVWSYLTVAGDPPTWRDFHSAVAVDDCMYVFGGRSDATGPYHSQQEIYFNEMMSFDTKNNTWSQPVTKGQVPDGRRSHSSFVYKNKIYIFGGYNGSINKHYNDLYEYDPRTKTWSVVWTKGSHKPCPRRRQCCCVVGDRLFLFGGTSPSVPALHNNIGNYAHVDVGLMDHSDLYVLDFAPSLKTLSILVALENNLMQSNLPKDIVMEITVMTTNNCISRITQSTG